MKVPVGQDEQIIEWTFVKLLRFSEECDIRYIEMSDEELEREVETDFSTFKAKVERCKIMWNECRRGKFDKRYCPSLGNIPDTDTNTRGNNSPRLLLQNLPLWPILTILFLI